ncbi:hypothetical protein [Streptomyces katrae]|uniref:Uncharacterized protein n=1 Tax=Streptomyces katrae TaxID=68223 RepID=A0A0F4JRW6_9ACTN|nr:hypothetical protein [Streptomyces katrae]KJY37107.1 hypothetical protein VR44_06585 [Streptomyces katrae]
MSTPTDDLGPLGSTISTALGSPRAVDVSVSLDDDSDTGRITLVASYEGKEPVRLTLDPHRAGCVAHLLMRAQATCEEHTRDYWEMQGAKTPRNAWRA